MFNEKRLNAIIVITYEYKTCNLRGYVYFYVKER